MVKRRILIIQGHPDPDPARFCRAIADAYGEGARRAGHDVEVIDVARLDLALLRTHQDFESGHPVPAIVDAQRAIESADHVVIVFPLWLGTMPALFKGFLEQVFRPGFAFDRAATRRWPRPRLKGRSVRLVVTMGMPAMVYRWYYRAHGLRSLERHVLRFGGLGPIRETLIGMVEQTSDSGRKAWLDRLRELGARGI